MRKLTEKDIKKRQSDIYKFMAKLHKLIVENPDRIIFKKMNGMDGYYDQDVEEIVIDPRKEVISTLVHESLHHFHPKWSESKVIREEHRIMNHMTTQQLKNLLVVLATCL